ncbi:MAG TPA: signal peptidase I [Methanobacterium sp.]|nr:signal peptidase I [Methanobacterium sp.]
MFLILVLVLGTVGISGCTDSGNNSRVGLINADVVVSGSMEPALYRGDIVIVDTNLDNIQVGDIIVYNATWYPIPIVHRVISIKHDSNGNTLYETKGDNNPVADPELITKNQIISKVQYTIPKIGYITLWLRGM